MRIHEPCKIVFRGCQWDDGWEYDAPCAVYAPIRRYGYGGNSCSIDDLVDSICGDLAEGKDVPRDWTPADFKEFEWRGWSPSGFSRRRRAVHVEIVSQFLQEPLDGEWYWNVASRREQEGPFSAAKTQRG